MKPGPAMLGSEVQGIRFITSRRSKGRANVKDQGRRREERVMFFSTESEVIDLAAAFYQRELHHAQWDKGAQLAVTLYYGLRFPFKMALELISDRVRKMGLGRYGSPESRAVLEGHIHQWLQ